MLTFMRTPKFAAAAVLAGALVAGTTTTATAAPLTGRAASAHGGWAYQICGAKGLSVTYAVATVRDRDGYWRNERDARTVSRTNCWTRRAYNPRHFHELYVGTTTASPTPRRIACSIFRNGHIVEHYVGNGWEACNWNVGARR